MHQHNRMTVAGLCFVVYGALVLVLGLDGLLVRAAMVLVIARLVRRSATRNRGPVMGVFGAHSWSSVDE